MSYFLNERVEEIDSTYRIGTLMEEHFWYSFRELIWNVVVVSTLSTLEKEKQLIFIFHRIERLNKRALRAFLKHAFCIEDDIFTSVIRIYDDNVIGFKSRKTLGQSNEIKVKLLRRSARMGDRDRALCELLVKQYSEIAKNIGE